MARARRHCHRLPVEIVEEILIRLPVKSLLRFRCVSKSWRSLISDHNFVRKHFNRASQPENLSQKTLTLMLSDHKDSANKNARFSCFLVDILPSLPKMIRRRKYSRCPFNGDSWLILSSLDGLLCVYVDRSIYIWNPCFNAYKRILTPKDSYLVQLGYDSATNDYQLFSISADIDDEPEAVETEIYSVKSESWRKLDDFPEYYIPMRSVFVDGSFYWLACGDYYDRPIRYALFSYDLSDNKYRLVCFPENKIAPNCSDEVELCVLRGMLCFLVVFDEELILWAMKDCSDQKSWTKVLDIALVRISDNDVMNIPMEYKPFYMYENGEVLMGIVTTHGTEVLVCKDDEVLFRKIISRKRYDIHYGSVHVESLISPQELN